MEVFTQRNFVAGFIRLKLNFIPKNWNKSVFEPPFGGLRGNFRTPSITRWKALLDFLFAIIAFFAISCGWEVISGNLSKSAFFEGEGFWSQNVISIYACKYICNQNWLKLPSLVWEIWCPPAVTLTFDLLKQLVCRRSMYTRDLILVKLAKTFTRIVFSDPLSRFTACCDRDLWPFQYAMFQAQVHYIHHLILVKLAHIITKI